MTKILAGGLLIALVYAAGPLTAKEPKSSPDQQPTPLGETCGTETCGDNQKCCTTWSNGQTYKYCVKKTDACSG
jgi:hypothetical protein